MTGAHPLPLSNVSAPTQEKTMPQLQMLLFPDALCCSLYERNCVCAVTKIFTKFLPANNFCQLLRVTRKRSCTSAGNAQAQLHFWDDQQRAFGISNISNWISATESSKYASVLTKDSLAAFPLHTCKNDICLILRYWYGIRWGRGRWRGGHYPNKVVGVRPAVKTPFYTSPAILCTQLQLIIQFFRPSLWAKN